jgi:outer membrane protein TolC
MSKPISHRSFGFFLAAWTLAVLLSAPRLLIAQDDVLSLEDAIRQALSANEEALSADQRLIEANARLVRARSFLWPSLSLSGTYTRRPFEVTRQVGETEITVQSYNAISGSSNLSLILFDSRSIPALMQARFDRQAEIFGVKDSKRLLAFEVSNAFLSALGIDQFLEASRQRMEFAKQSLEAATARHSAGIVSVNDVTLAQLEYATSEMGVTQVQGQVESAYLQLGNLLNSPPPKKLKTPDFLLQGVEGTIPSAEKLIAEAQTRRPDVQSLRWQGKSLRALTWEPILKWFPNFTLTGQYRYTNEAGLTGRSFNWNVGVTMSWSLFDGFTRNADYSERKALAIQADLGLRSALRKVELEVRDALVSLESQRAALKLAQVTYEVAVKNARETTELYRQGLSSALQVADANVRLFEANVEFVRARYGLGVAFLNLEAALGLDPLGKEPDIEN